jgi:hypothetical protein
MAYITAQARQELLDAIAGAIVHLGEAIAALGVAYEQLDEGTADRLEDELFGPVQKAYGRAQRTYTEFAKRYALAARSFAPEAQRLPSTGVKGLIEAAADAVGAADDELAQLQDSMMPVEVGDPELRAGLADVRGLVDGFRAHARDVVRGFGR